MPSVWTRSVPELIQDDPDLKKLVLDLEDKKINQALKTPMMFLGFPLVDLYYEAKKPENLEKEKYIAIINYIKSKYGTI